MGFNRTHVWVKNYTVFVRGPAFLCTRREMRVARAAWRSRGKN